MATPAKQPSRWGSFLQQAVAGVESRLDNILAEGDEAAKANKPAPSPAAPAAIKSESGISRSASSSSKTNDRLQERLAKAIAAKNTGQKGDSLALSSTIPSRTGSPLTANGSPRTSIDVGRTSTEDGYGQEAGSRTEAIATPDELLSQDNTPTVLIQPSTPGLRHTLGESQSTKSLVAEGSGRLSIDSQVPSNTRDSIDSARNQAYTAQNLTERVSLDESEAGLSVTKSPAEYNALLTQLKSDFEASELQKQEEIHGYIERIDALQAKLLYLAKESAETAKNMSGSWPSGSLEKKLADKEEQIALLLQEDSKELAEAKKKQEKAEKDVATLTERWKRAEGAEKRLNEKIKLNTQLQRDLEAIKADRDSKDFTISELKARLDEEMAQGREAETRIANESLEVERKRVAELEDDLSNLKIEKNLVSDRAQMQIRDLREKMDQEAERARIANLEMKKEQQILESKLEVMRARAEEVSSGATGDAQAKLLRQIETLQTQYAVASENWQGIEASLVARATNLEKERDEATRKEAEIRRKAREVALKAKLNEDELEEARSKVPNYQQELAEHKTELSDLRRRAEEAESALKETKSTFDRERQNWMSETQQKLDEERQKWQEETSGQNSLGQSRAESPITSSRRGLTSEFLSLQNLQIRRTSARSINSDVPTTERFVGRRASNQPIGRESGAGTPTRQDSAQSFTMNGEMPETTSLHTIDQDDFFENHPFSSPRQTINDMVSVSTAAAGPSVQLVERMSSAVRRLESEKAATKEELVRLSAQRDEARAEIVALMREVEAKRLAESKVTLLEEEVKDIHSRYQTTLEMLGEKSELVNELRSDVEDLKAMYRELIERTVK
ncbi:hypothetical protein B7494_g2212 [Chlorociboria aeruginascens]|nr:hypothetical protein B7494_g2212 [Chlorociboria aeruginascens]